MSDLELTSPERRWLLDLIEQASVAFTLTAEFAEWRTECHDASIRLVYEWTTPDRWACNHHKCDNAWGLTGYRYSRTTADLSLPPTFRATIDAMRSGAEAHARRKGGRQ